MEGIDLIYMSPELYLEAAEQGRSSNVLAVET